jgi:hypothetical protein
MRRSFHHARRESQRVGGREPRTTPPPVGQCRVARRTWVTTRWGRVCKRARAIFPAVLSSPFPRKAACVPATSVSRRCFSSANIGIDPCCVRMTPPGRGHDLVQHCVIESEPEELLYEVGREVSRGLGEMRRLCCKVSFLNALRYGLPERFGGEAWNSKALT